MTGSLNARAVHLAPANMPASTPLSPGMQANFQGFTFVDESSIDDHFVGRGDLDDNMDDDDMDWDDARGYNQGRRGSRYTDDGRSFDGRHGGKRMSGVVKSGDDEGGVFNGGMEI